MNMVFILLSIIFIVITIIFLYCSLVLAKRADEEINNNYHLIKKN